MSSGCMIIFRDSQNKKNLSCLCKTGGEPAKAGKILYMCYGEGKLDALFEGHNKACEKIESRIEKVNFLPVTENNNVAIGWIYKFDGGKWYVAEAQDGFYKPLEEEFTDEKDVAAIKQFLRTNHLPVKEQIDELKKNEGAPIGESDEMEEIPISLDDKTNAYYRRFLILNIDKRARYIPDLRNKLEREIEFFISKAVRAAHELFIRDGISESQNSKKAVEELYKQADSVQAFIIDEMEKEDSARISRTELYRLYTEYCVDNDRISITRNRFYKNLREKGYGEVQEKGTRCFMGLKQINDGFKECRNTVFSE